MKTTTKAPGLQGSIQKARKRKPAQIAHGAHGATSGRTGGDENGTQNNETSLPAFNLNARVSAKTGLFDHLEVSAKHGSVIGSCAEIDLFRLYAGAAPQELKANDTSEMYGRLFTVAPENGRKDLPLTIRSIPGVWGGAPLAAPPFSGKLRTKRSEVTKGEFVCYVTTHLHLNPSRGLNLCPALASKKKITWKEASLSRRTEAELAKGLDGKDNVIPFNLLGPACNSGERRYLEGVYTGIDSELRRASAAADGLPMPGTIRSADFSLRRVEPYHEFYAPDAVALVKKLAPSLRVFHRHNREREHGLDIETVGNSPTITLFLSKGEAVRVYAKTADRIRFEVIYYPKRQNGLIPDGYCAPTLDACMEKLHFLRQKAAVRVNQILAFLSEWADETPQDRASASRFASQWFQRLGFSDASERLLELLRVNGRIVAGRYLPQEERNALRRAKEQKLVFCDEHAHAFYPVSCGTPLPFAEHSLTDFDNSASFPGHKTETQPVASVPKSPTPIRKSKGEIRLPPCPPLRCSTSAATLPLDHRSEGRPPPRRTARRRRSIRQ